MASVDSTDSKVANDTDTSSVPVAAVVNASEPPKKRRGRPPKNAGKDVPAPNDDAMKTAGTELVVATDTDKQPDSNDKQVNIPSENSNPAEAKQTGKRGRKPKKAKLSKEDEIIADEASTVATLAAAAKAIAIADGTAAETPVPAEVTAGKASTVSSTDATALPSVPVAVAAPPGPEAPPTTAGSDAVGSADATDATDATDGAAPVTQNLPEGVPVPPKPGASTASKRGSVTHSEEPGNGKRPRVVLEVKMNEGGWEKELLEMSTVNLNKFLKSSQYTDDQMNGLKKTRRRVKNRIYAQRSRARKVVLNPDGTKVTPKKAKKAAEKAAKAAAEAAKAAAEAARTANGDGTAVTSDLASMIVDGVNKYESSIAKDSDPTKMDVDPAAKAAGASTGVTEGGTADNSSNADASAPPAAPVVVSVVGAGNGEEPGGVEAASAPPTQPASASSAAAPLEDPSVPQPAVHAAQ